ncbi:MAG: copper homeostasis protein CutC, partial [Clostridia bacterium]
MKIEVIASTLDDAMKIEQCGGDRIELIMGFEEDGLTPSMALIELVTKRVKIPVNVMVRPHAKSFVLNKFDVEVMKREIEIVKNTDANGIVIG